MRSPESTLAKCFRCVYTEKSGTHPYFTGRWSLVTLFVCGNDRMNNLAMIAAQTRPRRRFEQAGE